jgi:hypothetical protein
MSKLKIGYWPLSSNLQSAGDRRRVIFWAQARGHEVVTDLNRRVDVIIASEKSDFASPIFIDSKAPIIFDLIDAYLSPLNPIDDIARGLVKKVASQLSGRIKPFSSHVQDFCQISNAVICSSVEQELLIKQYNSNTHVILDSHEEIPIVTAKHNADKFHINRRILWEGQPATIRGVQQVSSALTELTRTNSVQFDFVTDQSYFQFLGKYLKRSTLRLLEADLSSVFDRVSITPWTTANLVNCAEKSDIAMIPIDLSVPMQRLKPENRLLIMWRLGLPCLTSASPAYTRVAIKAGTKTVCVTPNNWLENFKSLLENPSFAHEEVLRGQNYLHENHTSVILLNKWDRVIESVIG